MHKIYPLTLSNYQHASWQTQMTELITDVEVLFELLAFDEATKNAWQAHFPKRFMLRVPHAFVAKMAKNDINDPLLRQILPTYQERLMVTGFLEDPLAEKTHNPLKGVLHKYKNRVLITVTGACAVHCRYCFRQHFDYNANLPTTADVEAIIDYINAHAEIDEVLLSGGDPLNVSNRRLLSLLKILDERLPKVRTIRLHTRLPVVLPARIDEKILAGIKRLNKRMVMVIHTNHANELDQDTIKACRALQSAGVVLLNQTVLLKGVNDSVEALQALSHALFDAGVLPYYLHVLDKVAGAAHFDVPMPVAVALHWQLRERVSGYLLPQLVQELPNRAFKTPVDLYQTSFS